MDMTKNSWEIKALSEVCERTANIKWSDFTDDSFQYIDLSSVSRQSFSITESTPITSKTAPSRAKKIVKKDDVIFATTRPTLKRITVIPVDYDNQICSTGYSVLRNKPTEVIPAFIFYFLRSEEFMQRMENLQRGTSYPAVTDKDVKSTPIPIPPLAEQKQIVALLDQAFKAIDQAQLNIEKNIANAKELFQSKLNAIFSQDGEGWEERTLKEITTILGDGLHGTPKYTDEGDYYFINGNNLNNGKIKFKERTKRVSHEEYKKYKKDLNDKTVFVSINGTLGNVAFYNNEKVILGKSACYFNLLEGINKHFIKYKIQSPQFIDYMFKEATGATIKNVSLKTMRASKIHIPNLDQQNLIVKQLDSLHAQIENLKTTYSSKLINLEELKKSILQKAFNGELT